MFIISLEGLHGTDNAGTIILPPWWCTTTGIPSRIVYPDNRIITDDVMQVSFAD